MSVLDLNVDGLKHSNNTQWPDMGDRLLRKVAEIFKRLSDPSVYPYRMGSDEFLLVCPGYDEAAVDALHLQLQEQGTVRT